MTQILHPDDEKNDKTKLVWYEPNTSSSQYPWGVTKERQSRSSSETEKPHPGDIAASVEATFAPGFRITQFMPHHYFDYIAGTSTGGLSAILLARIEMDIDTALDQYDIFGNNVFAKPRFLHTPTKYLIRPKFKTKNIESTLKDVIAAGLRDEINLTRTPAEETPFEPPSSLRCRLINIAHGASDDRGAIEQTYMFRSYNHPHPSAPTITSERHEKHLNPGPADRRPIWKIARATSAAPTTFRSITIADRRFRDGGIVANNPAKLMLNEVNFMHTQAPKLLVSIGTGLPPTERNGHRATPRKLSYIQEHFDTLYWMKMILTQSESTHNEVLTEINKYNRHIRNYNRDRLHREKIHYHRFNVQMEKIPLDEWKVGKDGTNLTKRDLQEKTIEYLKTNEVHDELLDCARILVNIRRKRAETDRWESFATPYIYKCPEEDCDGIARTFETREELRNHAYDAHGYIWVSHITNDDRLEYVCFRDDCHRAGVHVFSDIDAYYSHLLDLHKIEKRCVFDSLTEFEEWLDKGRIYATEAVEYVSAMQRRSQISPVPGSSAPAAASPAPETPNVPATASATAVASPAATAGEGHPGPGPSGS